MTRRLILSGLVLGIMAIPAAFSTTRHGLTPRHASAANLPIPLCNPDVPDCPVGGQVQ